MKPSKAKEIIQEILTLADISVDGNGRSDIRVKNSAFYDRVLTYGSLGIGEAYMDGWWETDHLDVLAEKVFSKRLELSLNHLSLTNKAALAFAGISAQVLNHQHKQRSLRIRQHYDLDNELFQCMLDKRMVYSCAYWRRAKTLAEAQEAKLDLVCKKLYLQPGMRVLDIGCGWGSFAKFAAEKYGVSVVGINISQAQVDLGRKICHGLPVEIRLQDYRALDNDAPFDAIISLGMFEHVGYKNYRQFIEIVKHNLKPGGLFLLQTIGSNTSETHIEPWINKYIFPNAMLPSASQISKACEGIFVIEDWHNFGSDYDKTLMTWFENFDHHWPHLKKKYDDQFYRMWKFYLLTSAGSFRARKNQLWQIMLSDFYQVDHGYISIR